MDKLSTSAERVQHAMTLRGEWEKIAVLEEQLAATHPGAVDILYQRWSKGAALEDGDDLVLQFHSLHQFTVTDDNQLFTEFPYTTIEWDPSTKTWMTEDGEPCWDDE